MSLNARLARLERRHPEPLPPTIIEVSILAPGTFLPGKKKLPRGTKKALIKSVHAHIGSEIILKSDFKQLRSFRKAANIEAQNYSQK